MRFFIRLSYLGQGFCGWQSQQNAPSVQQALEDALAIAFGRPTPVVGAGRTDAGVNARDYFAHFDAEESDFKQPERLLHKINAILPRGIAVYGFYRVPEDAHARYDAFSRTYRYYIHTFKDPFATCSWYYTFPIDIDAMNRAAEMLLGTRDFACFEKKGSDNRTTVCTVTDAHWEEVAPGHLVFTVTANRFLRNMVRAMVGTLLEVGRGRTAPEDIPELLLSADRCRAGQSVPGEALFLEEIRYPYELLTI